MVVRGVSGKKRCRKTHVSPTAVALAVRRLPRPHANGFAGVVFQAGVVATLLGLSALPVLGTDLNQEHVHFILRRKIIHTYVVVHIYDINIIMLS